MSNKAFCPECSCMSEYDLVPRTEMLNVKGDDVRVESDVAVCVACGGDIGIPEIDDATFKSAYAVYRARHDLLQPEQIHAIREKYGLGQKAFARLLGWGDVTLARYEAGALQSKAHDQTLRLVGDPSVLRRFLAMNGTRLTEPQIATVDDRLAAMSADHETLLANEESATYGIGEPVRKLREMIVFFAAEPLMWRTKLNKMLFYADFLNYKRYGTSITQARYIHMQFGPVPADFYALQASLVNDTSIDETPGASGDRSGTIFVASRPADTSVFSAAELTTMSDIAEIFRAWTAGEIVEYSHQEPAWLGTVDRQTIPYSYSAELRLE